MVKERTKSSPEREHTDESLRIEREKTDTALSELEAVEDEADLLVKHARDSADAAVDASRDKADRRAAPNAPGAVKVPARESVVAARAVEDKALHDERAVADESLRKEREENARALSRLLPLERDETDRGLLNERACSDDAVANRDDFLGMASHDLRNLLGGIVMSAGLVTKLADDTDAGNKTLAEMKRIQRYAARMNRLIGDLLDVASIDAGKLSVVPVRGDLGALISEAVEMFRGNAAAKGISLEMDLTEPPLMAAFDHDRMLQVLANLIANALKFTAPGGSIVIRGARAANTLACAITDTGSGIPAEMLEMIFDRFCQVGENDRRGVGLGLYISRRIVEAHDGKIWAESTLGEGSTFRFTLPVSAVA